MRWVRLTTPDGPGSTGPSPRSGGARFTNGMERPFALVAALTIALGNLTLVVPPTAFAAGSVGGTVFEDIAGNALDGGTETVGDLANPGRDGVNVYLYNDVGPPPPLAVPDAGDTLVAGPIGTAGGGLFNFGSQPDGAYWVVVDSQGLGPNTRWAEQTYGPDGAWCSDGLGGTSQRVGAGACYGGRRGNQSDRLATWYNDAEHIARIVVSGGNVTNVDFGFSFNVATTIRGGSAAADPGATGAQTVQGSLRQFITNANDIAGANAMRFVPAEAPNDGSGLWWRIPVSSNLPAVSGASATIDGTSYQLANGTVARDQNPGYLGANAAGGLTVGVDGIALPRIEKPELELQGAGTTIGLQLQANSAVVRRLAVVGFSTYDVEVGPSGGADYTGIVIEDNVVGSGAGAFTGSLPAATSSDIYVEDADGAIVQNNLVGWANVRTVDVYFSVNVVVRGNELRSTPEDVVDVVISTDSVTIENNLISDGLNWGLEVHGANGIVRNNTIQSVGNGVGQSGGVRVFSAGQLIDRNIITTNGGPGVLVAGTKTTAEARPSGVARITRNEFGANTGLAIDLQAASDDNNLSGDGITLNDGATVATSGNLAIDFPVIDNAVLSGGNLVVTGFARPNALIEFYEAVGAANDQNTGGTAHGEGITWLFSAAESSLVVPIDTDPASGTYSDVDFGSDLTANRFSFTVAAPAGLVAGDEISATGSDGSNTSEFGPNFVVTANQPPTVVDDGPYAAIEDTQLVVVAASGVLINDSDPESEAFEVNTYDATSAQGGTVAVAADGSFTYDPAPNFNGADSFTYTAIDPLGSNTSSVSATVNITVGAINDEPSFTSGGDVGVNEDSGAYSALWATAISKGPANESAQTLTFVVTNNTNPGLFATSPGVSPITGFLDFTPAGNANGFADITIELRDNGPGAPAPNDNTSVAVVFRITVGAINDEPSFTKGADVTVDEDSGAYLLGGGWATAISKGPADESAQTLTFTVTAATPGLFATQPAVDPTTGDLTFTPAADANGTTSVDIYLTDSGSNVPPNDNVSPTQTFNITIGAINDEPSFTSGANQTVSDDAGPQSVAGWATVISKGPADESSQTLTFTISGNTDPTLFSALPAVSPIGTLTYTPAPGANGTATITLYLSDNGVAGPPPNDNQSPPQNFTITVTETDAVSGIVFDDLGGEQLSVGAAGDLANPGTAAMVYAFADDGTVAGEPDVSDSLVAGPMATVGGVYTIPGLAVGNDYWIVVDSTTITPFPGVTASADTAWAEQTYGPTQSWTTGSGLTGAADALYGGADPARSDALVPVNLTTSEHLTLVTASSGGVTGVDFGFSFNVVTNVDGTAEQGSLNQFIQNGNKVAGGNAMRFVPAVPTNGNLGVHDWWRIDVSAALPTITDANTEIDGRAFASSDGTTPRNDNSAAIGTGGGVGLGGTYSTPQLDPELEIRGDDIVASGIAVAATGDGATVRDVAVARFSSAMVDLSGDVANDIDSITVRDSVFGAKSPADFTFDALAPVQNGVMADYLTNSTIKDNLFRVTNQAMHVEFASTDNLIETNETRGANTGIYLKGSLTAQPERITVRGNAFMESGWWGVRMFQNVGNHTITENTIRLGTNYGMELDGTTIGVIGNIVSNNGSEGIRGTAPLSAARISRNRFGGNGGIAIDLAGDGITTNDDLDADLGPNGLLNFPIIVSAIISGGNLTVAGFARSGDEIEFYDALGGAGDNNAVGNPHGEGIDYLFTRVEGSIDDTDGSSGSYSAPEYGADSAAARFSFTVPTPVGMVGGDPISAIAIDAANNTSEFGPNGYVDRPPTIVNPGPQLDAEGASVTLALVASDPDGDPLVFSAVGLPPGLGLDPNTGIISGSPSFIAADSSPYAVTVTVTDGVLFDSELFTWTITESGVGLEITKSAASPGAVLPGDTITYTVTVTNVDSLAHTNVSVVDAVPAGATWQSTSIVQPSHFDVADDFDVVAYTNNDGVASWASNWVETGDDGSAGAGGIVIRDDATATVELALRVSDANRSVERTVDLASATRATLSFDYLPWDVNQSHEHVYVEIWDGSAWTILDDFTSIPRNSTTYVPWSRDITAYTSVDTKVRFRTSATMDDDEDGIDINNVVVSYSEAGVPTAGGAGPTHVSGATLYPGQEIVITYVVDIDDPPAGVKVDNDASTQSDAVVPAIHATTSNPITNRLPIANDDSASTDEDNAVTIDVLDNDTDPDLHALEIDSFTGASANGGSVTLDDKGNADPTDDELVYDPPSDFFGIDTFTYRAKDERGGVSNLATVTIIVDPINDEPSFTSGGNVAVNEDSGAYSAAWATSISKGPANESAQTLTFVVTGNTNPGLFSAAPGVDPITGSLDFTPSANLNGFADITIELRDNGPGAPAPNDNTSASVVFRINVNPVNDEPSFTLPALPDRTVLEDTLAFTEVGFATAMSTGPANESSQTLTFNVSNDNNPLFLVQPDIDETTGNLIFTVNPDANGSATVSVYITDNGGLANGGDDTSPTQTFVINVTPVNDEPSFTKGADESVTDDDGPQTVIGWATALSPGPANESTQTLSFTVTGNTDPSLFSVPPAVSSAGTLTYTPVPGADGATTITLHIVDSGLGAPPPNDNASPSQTFTITITETDSVAGVVFDDLVGDQLDTGSAGDAANPGAGAMVYAFNDDGTIPGVPDASDTPAAGPIATGIGGTYVIDGLVVGDDYWIVVDSSSVTPNAGTTLSADAAWAEQTYGPNQSWNGGLTGAAGALFGGADPTRSDGFSLLDLSTAEHLAFVTAASGGIGGVEFGFSFNVVSNASTGVGAGAEQGSLDQFIQNGNKVAGDNVMRFVPAVPTNATDGGGNSWWRIDVAGAISQIDDAFTTVDGTAYDYTDGATVVDSNSQVLAYVGPVGTGADGIAGTGDEPTLAGVVAPELEVTGPQTINGFELVAGADDFTLRDTSVWGFDNVVMATSVTRATIRNNVIGSGPGAIADPGASSRIWSAAVRSSSSSDGMVDGNFIGFTGSTAVSLDPGSAGDGWTVRRNEVRDAATVRAVATVWDGVQLTDTALVEENYISNSGGHGIDGWLADGPATIRENTVTGSGHGNGTPRQTAGIRLYGSDHLIEHNLITGNVGPGVSITGAYAPWPTTTPATQNRISRNQFGGNGGIAIDLVASGPAGDGEQGDGITLNDGGTDSTHGNIGIEYPITSTVTLVTGTTTIVGTSCALCEIEVYRAVSDGDFSDNTDPIAGTGANHGEGVEYLGTTFADGSGDWSLVRTTLVAADSVSAIAIDGSNNTSEFGPTLAVNVPPYATDDAATVPEDVAITTDVLANDGDVDLDPVTIFAFDAISASGGTVTLDNNGTPLVLTDDRLIYTPSADYNGPDSYTYTVTDGVGQFDTASVNITVTPVNDPPVLDPIADVTVFEADLVAVAVSATDVDGDVLAFSATGLPPFLSIDPATGSIVGIAGFDTAGSYLINVTVTDSGGLSDSESFTLTVLNSNRPPTGFPDNYDLIESETVVIGPPGVLSNDSDLDGDPITSIVESLPSRGTLTLNSDGSFTYKHTAKSDLGDSFTYRVFDGLALSDPVRVTLTIDPKNRPPFAVDDAFVIYEDKTGTFHLTLNDSDPDGDSLFVTAVTAAEHGTLTIDAGGQVTYTPAHNYWGLDHFTYTISDGNGGTSSAAVDVRVFPLNDPPIGMQDFLVVNDYFEVIIRVLANDIDPDGDFVILASVGSDSHGTFVANADGTVTFRAYSGFFGTIEVPYRASDGKGGTYESSIFISVPRSVAETATDLSNEVGAPLINFDVPDGIGVLTPSGVELLTGAFFQSLETLQVPLILLFIALMWSMLLGGFRWSAVVRLLPFLGGKRPLYAVVMRDPESSLPVYEEPGDDSKINQHLSPTTRDIVAVSKVRSLEGIDWIKIEAGERRGWVDFYYLTEQVTDQEFIEDKRVGAIIERMRNAFAGEGSFGSLVGERGLAVGLGGSPVVVRTQDVEAVVAGRSIPFHSVDFGKAVAEPFMAAAAVSPEPAIDRPILVSALIPTELHNFHFVSFGQEGVTGSWMAHFEYRKGKIYLVALAQDR